MDLSFYNNRKVFITGHTGFKGTWMCQLLLMLGADVTGYSLEPPTEPSLYNLCNMDSQMNSIIGDIRDYENLYDALNKSEAEIVIHMAAQPLVRESYKNPLLTYETNVMGTVNICEAVRNCRTVKSFINVTTDKVYLNKEWIWGYRENEELNGYDPYSNSKSCSELVTSSYIRSFFDSMEVAASTVRAGNVIGGGDFSKDRIIPDCINAIMSSKEIVVRNPYSVRPYEHVIEPIVVYLMIAEAQYRDKDKYAGSYNVGPNEDSCWNTGDLVSLFCESWNRRTGDNIKWISQYDGGPHEANYLRLDCSKLKNTFNWQPRWGMEEVIERIIEWTDAYIHNMDYDSIMKKQIMDYLSMDY